MHIYGDDVKRKFHFGVITNRVLVKKVIKNKHYLNVVKGYAVQKDIFDANESKIDELVFDEGNRRLRISKEDFLANRGVWTKGFGAQYTISEKFMQTI